MLTKESVRVGSIVKVVATGSGYVYKGTVVEVYDHYAVVEYKSRPNPLNDNKETVLTESYQFFDILEVVKY